MMFSELRRTDTLQYLQGQYQRNFDALVGAGILAANGKILRMDLVTYPHDDVLDDPTTVSLEDVEGEL